MMDKLREIILKYVDADPAAVTPEARFVEDLGFNSYDFMCMVGEVEEIFDVEVQERDAIKIKTVQDALSYIESLQ